MAKKDPITPAGELPDAEREQIEKAAAEADAKALFQISPEQREQLERMRAELTEQARKADAEKAEQYVGRTPAQIEEREAAVAAQEPEPDTSSAADRRIKLLEEQLAETNALVQKMAKDAGGFSRVAHQVASAEAELRRRKIYERITKNGGLCTIMVHTHEDPAQNYPVHVGLNGDRYILPRGEPIVVPVGVVEILDHAKVNSWSKEIDDSGTPRLVHHERLSYPYSLLNYSGDQLEAA